MGILSSRAMARLPVKHYATFLAEILYEGGFFSNQQVFMNKII
jgi:hypothetical protein